jgi:hypothetical protein
MDQQQKLTMSKIVITLFILSGYILLACNQNDNGNTSNGKMLFATKCLPCHNFKGESVSKLSLDEMSRLDSSDLINKLIMIRSDSIHIGHLANINYSNSEIQSLLKYIKDFSKPQN